MTVTRNEIQTFTDCHPYVYQFDNVNDKITFYQSGNRDLNLSCYSKSKKVKMIISNDEYLLYESVLKLWNNITTACFLKNMSDVYIKSYQRELYDGNRISWKSDAMIDEFSNVREKKYNYLNIYRTTDSFVFELINNSDNNNFVIEFNTDRSRYGSFVYAFWLFLQDLKEITEPYRQITIEEYLHEKTFLKKKEK